MVMLRILQHLVKVRERSWSGLIEKRSAVSFSMKQAHLLTFNPNLDLLPVTPVWDINVALTIIKK